MADVQKQLVFGVQHIPDAIRHVIECNCQIPELIGLFQRHPVFQIPAADLLNTGI